MFEDSRKLFHELSKFSMLSKLRWKRNESIDTLAVVVNLVYHRAFGDRLVSMIIARDSREYLSTFLFFFFQVSYLNFERQPSSIAAVGIANGMMVSCNKLRSGFENVGSVTGTFYPPVASPHDQSLQHYTSTQSSKNANYSMQSTVEGNYNPVQCANRQQSMGIRGTAEGCSGNVSFIFAYVGMLHLDGFQRTRICSSCNPVFFFNSPVAFTRGQPFVF